MGTSSKKGDHNRVLPFKDAETPFIQVLPDRIALRRHHRGQGARLRIKFGPGTDAIRHRDARESVKEGIQDFSRRAKDLQKKIDSLLGRGQRKYLSIDKEKDGEESFPFRYANGGALPVFSMGGQLYYCFRWRDVDPVGWNIANGGSDNRQELLNPELIIERELLEELIIIDSSPGKACRYVFETDEGGRAIDHDAEAAWREWRKRFVDNKYPVELQHQITKIPLMWLRGPDSLQVEFDGELQPLIEGVFLNINAADFGIEIDRVVHMHLPEGAILCDGELLGGKLLDSPIGLFAVDRFRKEINSKDLRPDHLFQGGRSADPGDLEAVIEQFLKEKRRDRQLRKKDREQHRKARKEGRCFDLCPVTRTIVRQHLRAAGAKGTKAAEPEVFISFASEDVEFARRLHDTLEGTLGLNVFLSDRTLTDSDYGKGIDQALKSARCLIAIGTKVEHLRKGWPDYEWRSFHQEILSGNKPKGELVSLISGFDPLDLPRQLRFREAITCPDPSAPETVLPRLMRFVARS